jgi:hypothetical protein
VTALVAIIAVVCVTGAAAWAVSVVFRDSRARDRAWEKKETAWAVERAGLLDRIMYLSNHPWESPPIDHEPPEPEPHPDDVPYDPTMRPLSSEYDFYPSGVV